MALTVNELARLEALERRVTEQAQCIADLESRIRSRRLPESLRQRNVTRQIEGARLRQAVAAVLERHSADGRVTAKHVLQTLARASFDPLPSERTVRAHIAALRGSGNTRRAAVAAIAVVVANRKLLP